MAQSASIAQAKMSAHPDRRSTPESRLSTLDSGAGTQHSKADAFAPLAMAARPALEQYARRQAGDYAEDVVSDAILRAMSHLDRFDFATGAAGARKWLFGILNHVLAAEMGRQAREIRTRQELYEYRRERARDQAATQALAAAAADMLDAASHAGRLTDVDFECLRGFVERERPAQTGRRLGISRSAVYYHRAAAIRAVRAPWPFSAPNLDAPRWKCKHWPGGNDIPIYRAPQKTGAGLAREALKHLR